MKTYGSFLKSHMLVLMISNATALVGYINQVWVARHLPPWAFANVTAVLSMAPLIFSVLSAFPLLATKVVKENQPQEVLDVVFTTALIFSVLFILNFAIFLSFFKDWIRIDSYAAFYTLMMQIFLMFFVNFYSGILLAKGGYAENSFKDFLLASFKFMISFFGLQLLAGNFLVPLVAECLSAFMVAVCLFLFLKKKCIFIPKFAISWSILSKENLGKFTFLVPAAATSWIIGALLSFDIPTSKALFTPHVAGVYSVASTLGKVGYFVSAAIAQVTFASSLGEDLKTQNLWGILGMNFVVTMGIAACIAGIYTYWGSVFLVTLFGEPYAPGAAYLPRVTFAMGLLSFLSTLVNLALARKKYVLIYLGILATIICNFTLFKKMTYASPSDFSSFLIQFFGVMVSFFMLGLLLQQKHSQLS